MKRAKEPFAVADRLFRGLESAEDKLRDKVQELSLKNFKLTKLVESIKKAEELNKMNEAAPKVFKIMGLYSMGQD